MLHVRALMPWTLLKVITAVLRARKRDMSSIERFALANHAARRWLHLLDPQAPRRNPGFELLLSGREACGPDQGLRGLETSDFCWSRSEKLPLPFGGSTSAAMRSRFACASGLAGFPPAPPSRSDPGH